MSKNRFLLLTTVFLQCGLSSLILFPTARASASYPSTSVRTLNLNFDYQQCDTKARQAADIVLSQIDEESFGSNEGILSFVGYTSESTATIMCIQDGSNSIFTVIANGDGYSDRLNGEAKSISDRFVQIMSGDI